MTETAPGFALAVPNGWKRSVTDGGSTVDYSQPGSAEAGLDVTVIGDGSFSDETSALHTAQTMANNSTGHGGGKLVGAVTANTVLGMPGAWFELTATDTKSKKRYCAFQEFLIDPAGQEWALYSSDDATAAGIKRTHDRFQTLVKSFRLSANYY
ncbi:hypothetical protein BIV57_07930 [Mangrovactinospora gilvigrisea]|uniref:Uncharacterized protein n=1 Tax=Mangrovactinospora gilvigrisea TaxID=1428644 RepID=A0A1J7BH61_9ACTN|nr:hypothetical protein BIV57_07930 [Mangrovactinospora gilvigrisea]